MLGLYEELQRSNIFSYQVRIQFHWQFYEPVQLCCVALKIQIDIVVLCFIFQVSVLVLATFFLIILKSVGFYWSIRCHLCLILFWFQYLYYIRYFPIYTIVRHRFWEPRYCVNNICKNTLKSSAFSNFIYSFMTFATSFHLGYNGVEDFGNIVIRQTLTTFYIII